MLRGMHIPCGVVLRDDDHAVCVIDDDGVLRVDSWQSKQGLVSTWLNLPESRVSNFVRATLDIDWSFGARSVLLWLVIYKLLVQGMTLLLDDPGEATWHVLAGAVEFAFVIAYMVVLRKSSNVLETYRLNTALMQGIRLAESEGPRDAESLQSQSRWHPQQPAYGLYIVICALAGALLNPVGPFWLVAGARTLIGVASVPLVLAIQRALLHAGVSIRSLCSLITSAEPTKAHRAVVLAALNEIERR